ncbi:MAG TPA: 30S ribosomal protein S9 [Candidatus Nesterenkonia stercoripullorum]|uniref:Small ribosomal subunit protein uS9 n=1 Tax=Candidatus Nesterenkonia stercoripullorum TaxID=2838701 RepID=A0A9D1US66_9MICC|nr:30S ribosomal protein S9 [Candidatus Nesterenkonia stercoripullorum]
MAQNTAELAENEELTSYTSESTTTEEVVETERAPLTVGGAAIGRRKRARARVRLIPGSGSWTINGRNLEDYFPNKLHQQEVSDPFTLLGLTGSYDVVARIDGGGPSGQSGAMRLGISRALNEIDREHNRPALKKAGFLSRDDRAVERKKAGLKKARKAPQYSKR